MIRKKLKALLILLTTFVLALAITGCAGAAGKKNKNNQQTKAVETVESQIDEKQDGEKQTSGKKAAGKQTSGNRADDGEEITEDGEYTSKDDVALYIHLFEHLPDNYITKDEAKKLGWVSSKGNLWDVAPGKSIGGDRFGNREGLLPDKKNRKYYECDIDYEGGYRGDDRIIYSNDGLVYFTGDHYSSYELLYGEE